LDNGWARAIAKPSMPRLAQGAAGDSAPFSVRGVARDAGQGKLRVEAQASPREEVNGVPTWLKPPPNWE